jgi:hypothetical protein
MKTTREDMTKALRARQALIDIGPEEACVAYALQQEESPEKRKTMHEQARQLEQHHHRHTAQALEAQCGRRRRKDRRDPIYMSAARVS